MENNMIHAEIDGKPLLRASNFELLRLVAMFMILMLHSNFGANVNTIFQEFQLNPTSAFTRTWLHCMANVAVDLFVLLSGWFGIRAKFKGIFNIVFGVWFLGFSSFLVLHFGFGLDATTKQWLDLFIPGSGLWFIHSYIILYAFAPMLEVFVKSVDQRSFKKILIGLILIAGGFGWVRVLHDFNMGFSALHLMVVYLIGRYLKLHQPPITEWSKTVHLSLYLLVSVLMACVYLFTSAILGVQLPVEILYHYNSPFMLCASVSLFLFFSKINLRSKVVNYLAASSLAVYAIQECSIVRPVYMDFCKTLYMQSSGIMTFVVMGSFFLCFMMGCILIDQIRIFVWKRLLVVLSKLPKCCQL